MIDAQITHTLKFRYAQDMGNHQENLLWPTTHTNPNYTLCSQNTIDTWPHLLSTCTSEHLKGLCIALDNKVIHQVAHTHEPINKQDPTFINGGHHNSSPQDNTLPDWLLLCSCASPPPNAFA